MKNEEALKLLETAIKLVKPFYLKSEVVVEGNNLQTERSFVYELYCQVHKLLDIYNNLTPGNQSLIVSAEVTKHLHNINSDKEDAIYYPDLLIHGGPQTKESQIAICEFKRYETKSSELNNKIKNDIQKLINFTSDISPLKFNLGVFVMLNISIEDLKDQIMTIISKEKLHISNFEKIYIISVKEDPNCDILISEKISLKDLYI